MDTKNQTITIESTEDTEKKVILKCAGAKFYFWKKKQDGTETKAYQQFQKFNFRSGDSVDAAIKEQERTFTNEKGKEITYLDRNIAFFLVQDNVPVATQPQVDPQTPRVEAHSASSEHSVALKAYLQQLETRLKALELKVDKLEYDSLKDPTTGEKIPF